MACFRCFHAQACLAGPAPRSIVDTATAVNIMFFDNPARESCGLWRVIVRVWAIRGGAGEAYSLRDCGSLVLAEGASEALCCCGSVGIPVCGGREGHPERAHQHDQGGGHGHEGEPHGHAQPIAEADPFHLGVTQSDKGLQNAG